MEKSLKVNGPRRRELQLSLNALENNISKK
jgi:hypothetical protein